ncbi:MAG: type II toxin-antitoxin system HicA family toxin [bacterium]|jgi:predicted RNA binding protein YcfA (HicA-like mRNA interferase family)
MRIPRDLSGREFLKKLSVLGYEFRYQTGSHLICETLQNGKHRVSIPNHNPVKVGTLSWILGDIADHHGKSQKELMLLLFGK